jgi:hypothetical protein
VLAVALHLSPLVLGQSEAPATEGSNPAVIVIGVLVVTAIIAFVVARLSKR